MNRKQWSWRHRLIALAFILAFSAFFRFYGIDWDEGTHLHPDERFLTMVVSSLDLPSSAGEYFDESRSPLNPRNQDFSFFVYGALPISLTTVVADFLGLQGYDEVYLVGRALSALFDLGSIFLLFVLAVRLYRDDRVALLAAALLGTSVLPIQHSHFFVVENFAVFFSIAVLIALVSAQRRNRLLDYGFSGILFGMAVACKISLLLLGGVVAIVMGLNLSRGLQGGATFQRSLERLLAQVAVFAFGSLLLFKISQPDAFQGFLSLVPSDRWLANLREVSLMMTGEADPPFGHQWMDRSPLWYPWKNMVLWGMGIPLGIASWAGLTFALVRLGKRELVHLVPVSWIVLLFLYQGSQWVKASRYFLPIYPVLVLLGAWGLIRLSVWIHRRGPLLIWRRGFALMPLLLVLGGSFIWASAFLSVYEHPHTRIQASRWIYQNVPAGSVIATEHWDDSLPLPLGGRNPAQTYDFVQLPWYEEASPEKLDGVIASLDEADFVVISSQRLVDSIPRMPLRFPVASNYYRNLFSGALGWQLEKRFLSFPAIGGIEFRDRGAEEAFSVYDHPPVWIFSKTEDFQAGEARDLLSDLDWSRVLSVRARDYREAAALFLEKPKWERLLESKPYHPTSPRSVMAWCLGLIVLGCCAFFIILPAWDRMPDGGWAFSKLLGLLFLAWPAWWLASLGTSFDAWNIRLVALFLALLAAAGAIRIRSRVRIFWRQRKGRVVASEIFFWTAFFGFLVLRSWNPDLWHPSLGGEKPMDFAYFQAILNTPFFPPYDPWFSGGALNYYYFGFVLFATLTKAVGVLPEVAYNLALATLFALAVQCSFGACQFLVGMRGPLSKKGWLLCLLAPIFSILLGNLGQIRLVMQALTDLSVVKIQSTIPGLSSLLSAVSGFGRWLFSGAPLSVRDESWFWDASRVVGHAAGEAGIITEFPYFTYLFGDLHAHAMAFPFTLLALGTAAAAVKLRPRRACFYSSFVLAALVLGTLWSTNTWDLPTFALVFIGLQLLDVPRVEGLSPGALLKIVLQFLLLLLLAYLMFLPFHRSFVSGYGSFRLWEGSGTALTDLLLMFGFFLFLILSALIYLSVARWGGIAVFRTLFSGQGRTESYLGISGSIVEPLLVLHRPWSNIWKFLDLAILLAFVTCLGTGQLVSFALILLLLAALFFLTREHDHTLRGPALLLFSIGCGLCLLAEWWVLRGDVGRMNTVFKIYFQVWALWSFASVLLLPSAWGLTQVLARSWRVVWFAGFAVLFGVAVSYPLTATPARIKVRFEAVDYTGLDGTAFMESARYSFQDSEFPLAEEREAFEWFRQNAQHLGTVMEANTSPVLYSWGSRYSVYTGLPTVIGWDWHQRQQRTVLPGDPVKSRLEHVREFYETLDVETALGTLARYQIRWIVLGPLERICYESAGLDKFSALEGVHWRLRFQNDRVRIYEVLEEDAQ